MYKLRRSRFAKLIAGFLVFFLCAAIVGNLVGTFIIMDENLYYASRQQLQQKLYSYVYEYTAGDLMRYLKTAENIYSNDEYYRNYNQSELDLYVAKYSPENSNIYFEITDEYGNLLLHNEKSFENHTNAEYLHFSSAYGWNYSVYYDDYYGIGGSDKSNIITVTEAQTTSFDEENVTSFDDITETTTFPPQAEVQKPVPVPDNREYLTETVNVRNSYSDNMTTLTYKYTSEPDEEILSFIKQQLMTLPCDISDITVYQDEFYREYYDEDNDTFEIIARYYPSDAAAPDRSFSTTLMTEGRKIPVYYNYSGTLSLSQLGTRLKHLTLAALNNDSENLSFSVTQKDAAQIKVSAVIPCRTENVRDIYYYAEGLVDFAIFYKNNIIPITVFYFIGFVTSLIFIFWASGYVPKRDEPVARWLHAIPFDLYVFLSALGALGCFAMIDTSDALFMLLGFTGWAILLIALVYTIPVRVRTKTLRQNTLICRIYRSLKHAAEVTGEATGSRIIIALILFAFIFISMAESVFFNIWGEYDASFIIAVIRIIEVPLVLFVLVAITALHNGAKAISKGDTSYRISSSFLFGPFKRHAEYLNNINDGVNKAVEERLRSESLKTELITNVSHDLKTPLTSIVNYIDLLKKTDVKDEKAKEYIEVIDRQSQRLKKLTIDIVEASKAATGNVQVNYEDTALNVILLQTNGEYIERLQEKNLTLVQEIPEEDIRISTDGRLLWRVIDNLMNNICKYSMPGTRVYLTLWENNGRAFISFRNISRNKLNITPENLTERFVRGDSSRNTEGSGLGLSIANSLTEIMGGKLSIIIDGDLFKVTLSFPTIGKEE